MNDKELADKVVALGVGQYDQDDKFTPYFWSDHRYDGTKMAAELFIRDWRVAGALMERITNRSVIIYLSNDGWDVRICYYTGSPTSEVIESESRAQTSLPRAIIEAFVRYCE